MIVKMLTHVHMLVHTLWCWHTLRRRWSLEGRERMDSALFEKMKCIFSIAPVGIFGEVTGVFLAEEHSPDAGSEAPDAVSERPVCRLPDSVRVRHWTIGTGRSLERQVVCVRCEVVLQTSLRMSPVSTGRSGCVRWLASGDPASLRALCA